MTEKRFKLSKVRLNNPNAIRDDGEPLTQQEVVDLLNSQDSRIKYLERKIDRERNATQTQHEKWDKQATERIKELEKENDELKQQLKTKYIVNKQYEELQKLNHIIDWCLINHREVSNIVFDSRDEFFIWLHEKGVI
jgi:actin-related protein